MDIKIGLEIQWILKKKSGIGIYTESLANALSEKMDNSNDLLNGLCFDFMGRNRTEQLLRNLNYKILLNKIFPYGLYRRLWSFIPFGYNHLFADEMDIYHFFNYIVPPKIKGKVVLTVYDMVMMKHPETMNDRNYHNLCKNLERSAKSADLIITISENSKKEIIEYLQIPEEQIAIISPAVDHDVYFKYSDQYKPKEAINVKEKYALPNKFILYLGTLEPRKNINSILNAYDGLSEELKEQYKLVIAGGKGWKYQSIFSEVERLGLSDSVIFTGYVDDTDKPSLYNMATLFIFPSLYEGFGMPPLEAMACGTPVIVSNTSSLPEVVGDAGMLVDPYDVCDITDKITVLLSDEDLRNQLSEKAIKRAQDFSWEKSARTLLECYKKLMNSDE